MGEIYAMAPLPHEPSTARIALDDHDPLTSPSEHIVFRSPLLQSPIIGSLADGSSAAPITAAQNFDSFDRILVIIRPIVGGTRRRNREPDPTRN